jgi:hypothetical protein
MRNIFVYLLIAFGFCSLGVYSTSTSWELPDNFHIINGCLNSDSEIIYILGGYVNADNEFTEIDVLSWDTSNDAWKILKRDVVTDIENATFDGTALTPNNNTFFFCSDNGVYFVQGYSDANSSRNKMFHFKSGPSLLNKFALSNLFLLIFVVLFII